MKIVDLLSDRVPWFDITTGVMKVPLNWLRDYVALPTDVSELVDRLTISGLEVAAVRFVGLPIPSGLKVKQAETGPVWEPDKVVTAQVVSIAKHPNADKLKLVELDYGTGTPKQVVTGAPNIAVGESGQKVVLGLTGCKYFDGHATPKDIKELKPSMLRGVPSDSMVMSTFELGIDEEHEGIILLDTDAPVGKPLVEYMGDVVIEIDVLPNMARCLAMIGVAREVAALTGKTASIPAHQPTFGNESIDGLVSVEIADPNLCARYSATILRNVQVAPSPNWLRTRLSYAGMRPINNIVDITNYVMLEYGQPLHAFDYDVLVKRAGGKVPKIAIRAAFPNEKLKTLDGQERTLSPENLVIADTQGPIALAGVMGGLDTEVTEGTKTILLESASFDFVSIRRTSRQFTLFSEAATRFSKGIPTEVVKPAAQRAAQLLQLYAYATVLQGMVDQYPLPTPIQKIPLKQSEIRRMLGIDLPANDIERILGALDFRLEPMHGAGPVEGWLVTVPTSRIDLQAGAADLIEEIARVYGYDRLPATLLSGELPPQRPSLLALEERTRDILANAGLQEVVTYSMTSRQRELPFGQEGQPYIEILNDISPDRKALRRSLLPSVLDVVAFNLKNTDTVKVFEIGFVYLPKPSQALPEEPRRLTIALTGRRDGSAWDDPLGGKPDPIDFFDLKGVIETLVGELHLPKVTYRTSQGLGYLHPGRSAELFVNELAVGSFGELHPKTAQQLGLGERAILVADLDLDSILKQVPFRYAYIPIPAFPAALRDIAIVVDEAVSHETITQELRAGGGAMLTEIRLFDVYRGDQVPAGSKSLAFALTYQGNDRTLTDKEIEKAHKKVEDRMRHVLKAKIRGKDT